MGSTAGHLYRKWGWLAASLALIFTLSGVLARQQLQRTQQQTFRRELAEQISLMAHNLQRLETSPLTTKLRLDSLEIAIKTQAMLQKQAATSLLPADPDLARKLALAYLNLGRLTLATSNTEQLQTALPSLQTAQTMLEKLIAAQITAQPPATDLRYQLALALKTQAEIKTLTPLLRTAGIKNLQEAENLANNLVTTAPQNTEYRALLADCQLKIGDLLKTKQDFFSALTYYQRALQQRQEIVNKGDSTDQHNLAIIHRRVTAIYAAIADLLATQAATKYLAQQLYAEATISVQKTFPLILSLASESPRLVSETAEHHFQIGAILLKTGKLSEAEKNLTIARKEFQNLVAQDFNNAELQGRLADTIFSLLE
jgi:tetratricopeptide (TPR) repeat protein